MSSGGQTWIQLAVPGTTLILDKKSKHKSARQKNKNSQKEFGRLLVYFLDLEKDAGTLDSPSFGMTTSLKKIQKAQSLTEQSMEQITKLVSDLTFLLADIQIQDGITDVHIKELETDIKNQESKLEARANEIHRLVRRADHLYRK